MCSLLVLKCREIQFLPINKQHVQIRHVLLCLSHDVNALHIIRYKPVSNLWRVYLVVRWSLMPSLLTYDECNKLFGLKLDILCMEENWKCPEQIELEC